jgi:hypothetical protein
LGSNAVVVVTTDGGFKNLGTATGDLIAIDIELVVDGIIVADRRHFAEVGVWFNKADYWSYTLALPLTPGTHTIAVVAQLAFALSGTGAAGPMAIVGGGPNEVTRGTLTTLVLNR